MKRTWTTVAAEYTKTPGMKGQLSKIISELEWQEVSAVKTLPMMPGMAIKEAIKELHIPKVSKIAWNGVFLNRYGVLGIEGHYKNGRARVYILDRGSDLVPIASDFEENGK